MQMLPIRAAPLHSLTHTHTHTHTHPHTTKQISFILIFKACSVMYPVHCIIVILLYFSFSFESFDY